MGWFRSKRWIGGQLALFALALQLALSFAHVHAEDFAGLRGNHIEYVTSDASGSVDRDGIAHDQCAICATVQLLASAALPPPPAPALPVMAAAAWQPPALAEVLRGTFTRPFQARAPPTT